MCHVCKIQFPNEEIPSGKHKCWACRNIFDNTEWTKKILSKHRLCQRRIVCTACAILGYTSRDVSTYCCIDCNRNLGRTMFHRSELRKSRQRRKPLRCLKCKSKCKCIVCGHRFEQNKKKRENQICSECRQNGYSMMHRESYTCTACKMSGGYRKFIITSTVYRHKKHLLCVDCNEVKANKIRCKCNHSRFSEGRNVDRSLPHTIFQEWSVRPKRPKGCTKSLTQDAEDTLIIVTNTYTNP